MSKPTEDQYDVIFIIFLKMNRPDLTKMPIEH